MTDADISKIIKWVIIVLLAGFVGQFGKSFAVHLIERVKNRRKSKEKMDDYDGPQGLRQSEDKEKCEFLPSETEEFSDTDKEKAKQEKKIAKALAKQKKKEVK